ncbi:hypothetical protein KEJ48_07615 [Candidatus Bathyarchaeota archaeon]|nr:hypothetical protein [Candidatus Bathyarchaeota archaeon]MBS7617394.1 hypothetical protein [Candidatus Bathyarchaeota archaeon]
MRLRIRGSETSITTSALVNSGFEAEEPQLVIPIKLAEALSLTNLQASIEDLSVAGGGRVSGYRIEERISVELIMEDRKPVKAEAVATILPGEGEVIISDNLASNLGIVILDPHKGLWCLRDELNRRERTTVQSEKWI